MDGAESTLKLAKDEIYIAHVLIIPKLWRFESDLLSCTIMRCCAALFSHSELKLNLAIDLLLFKTSI